MNIKQDLNVYTVMLIASFLALLIGCIALAVEFGRYDGGITPWRVPASAQVSHVPQLSNPLVQDYYENM